MYGRYFFSVLKDSMCHDTAVARSAINSCAHHHSFTTRRMQ